MRGAFQRFPGGLVPENDWNALRQCVEQHLGLLQIERVEAFGELAVNRSKKFVGLMRLTLIAPEPPPQHPEPEPIDPLEAVGLRSLFMA